MVKSYEDLKVFRLAFDLAVEIHMLSMEFPKIEQFKGIADQIRRSSKGIGANIAEGLSKRMSKADEQKFLSIALGSAEETRVWLLFCERLGYLETNQTIRLREQYSQVCRMIYGLQEMRKAA